MLGMTTTSLIAFIFGVLVNVGKKVVCLQCRFKVDATREILTETFAHVVVAFLFLVIHFALSWPHDSLP